MGGHMRVSRTSSPRFFRTSWVAAVALVAVLFQALASGAMAHTITDRGVAQVICMAQGAALTPLTLDGKAQAESGKGKTASGLPCQDCVTAATAAIAPPDPCATLVRYARKAQVWRDVADTVRHTARAPPRPPGQAPPIA
jgi:hypothetical protein